MRYVNLLIMSISLIAIVNCKQVNEDKMEFIIFVGCKDIEVLSDLENSGEALKRYFVDKNIKYTKNNQSGNCGYLLKNGRKEKFIESAMTDIDLLEICKNFYQ